MTDRRRPIAFIDCETTGLDIHSGHRPWEVAAVIVHHDTDGGPDVREWQWELPVDLTTADPVALDIGGYIRRVTDDGRAGILRPGLVTWRFTDAADALNSIAVALDGTVIAGSKPTFDMDMLAATYRDHDIPAPFWYHHPLDVASMAAGWLAARSGGTMSDPFRSVDLSAACGVTRPDGHTALGDARWCYDWWRTMTVPSRSDVGGSCTSTPRGAR